MRTIVVTVVIKGSKAPTITERTKSAINVMGFFGSFGYFARGFVAMTPCVTLDASLDMTDAIARSTRLTEIKSRMSHEAIESKFQRCFSAPEQKPAAGLIFPAHQHPCPTQPYLL